MCQTGEEIWNNFTNSGNRTPQMDELSNWFWMSQRTVDPVRNDDFLGVIWGGSVSLKITPLPQNRVVK